MAFLLPVQEKPAIVAIDHEPMHRLVLENDYVRVFDVTVPPGQETKYHRHDRDYIFVTLGDTDVESTRIGETPVTLKLKDGEVRFTKGGFAHKARDLADTPFHNITIELKKPVLAAMEACAFPKTCDRRITAGGMEVGTTRLLLGNGSLNVFRTEIAKGAGLSTTYYSSAGADHVLIIALTQLDFTKSGAAQSLSAGQVDFGPGGDFDVDSAEEPRSWIAVRIHEAAKKEAAGKKQSLR